MNDLLLFGLPAAAVIAAAALAARKMLHRGSEDDWTPPRPGSQLDKLGISARLRDFYRLAVMVEEEGQSVYNTLAEIAAAPNTRHLCKVLAAKEGEHKRLFEHYLHQWEKLNPNKAEWPVLMEELKKAGIFEYLPERGANEQELAWYAVRQEVRTAKFYQLFEDSFPDSWRRLKMHELVMEEQAHEKLIRDAYPQLPA